MRFLINPFCRYRRTIALLIALTFFSTSAAVAQCYPYISVYQTYPYGALCSSQTITIRAEYIYQGSPVYGELRWYESETATSPVQWNSITSDYVLYDDYSFYATPGSVMWVSFYDYYTACETSRVPFTPYFSTVPSLYQDYARECGDGIARVQMSSNVTSGISYYLYKYNQINASYDVVDANNTGYFEIYGFDAADQNNYFVQIYQPGGCSTPSYYQLGFDITPPTAPTISGTTVICEGQSTTLSASGGTPSYRWYDGSGSNLLYEGWQYPTPNNLSPGSYNYLVRGLSYQGCLTNVAPVTVTVNPKPVDGAISASATTIHIGESVTITSQGGVGVPHYWCSNDGGTNWNIFSDGYVGSNTFTHTPPAIGTYRYHIRNQTSCGYCWDISGCTSFNYVDVNVIDWPPVQPGTVSPAYQIIPYHGTATTLTVSGISGGNGTYTYQWETSINADFSNSGQEPGATSSSYTPTELTQKRYYRLAVTSNGVTVHTNIVAVDVYPELNANTLLPLEIVLPSGGKPGVLSSGPATGGSCNGDYTYQWQQSTDGISFTDISGAIGLTYEPADPIYSAIYYRRKAKCGTTNEEAFTNAVHIIIGAVDVQNLNYIRTRTFGKPGVTNAATADGITSITEVKQITDYYDGLGRLMQTVAKQDAKDNKDIVVPVLYDQYGRQALNYLPYISPTGDGNYKANALSELNDFHKVQNAGESFYYSKMVFEPTPLNRVNKTMAPGNSWTGSNRGVENKYEINTLADDVKRWTVTENENGFGSYNMEGVYPAGSLYKKITLDEKGSQVIEFTDKEGQLVLKKTQLTATADNGAGNGHEGWLCIYYIYDKMGMLRASIQPAGVKLLTENQWDITALNNNILDEQCFRYEYDERKRMIMKKVPGAGEVYMIYDARDRQVFNQDASMRQQGQWHVTLYDNMNRVVLTALTSYTGSAAALQLLVTTKTFTTGTPPSGVQSEWNLPYTGQSVPISGVWQASNYISLNEDFESGSEFTAEIVTEGTEGSNGTIIEGVTITNNPLLDGMELLVLTKTGYDTYTTIPATSGLTGNIDNAYTGSDYMSTSYSSFPFPEQIVQSQQTKGMVTWTQSRILGTNQFIYSVPVYDQKGRPVQVKNKNNTGGQDVFTTQYSFTGRVLVSVDKQEKTSSSNPQTHITVTKNSYTELGQLKGVTKKINSVINGVTVVKPEIEIAKLEYNAMGQLQKTSLGKKKDGSGNYTSDAIQTLNQDYNIRGWLLGVNRDYLTSEGQTSDGTLFGFELGYDKTANKAGQSFSHSEYTGSLNGMLWKSDGDDIRRKYDFTYDASNRLLKADFIQQNADDHQWNNSKVNYSIKMGDGSDPWQAYDANGNIQRMQQWGLKLTGSTQIDDMIYTYYNNGNKLRAVTEQGGGAAEHKLGDFTDNNKGPDDYTYDGNGNLISDLNKRIKGITGGGITYNHLSLPQQIRVEDENHNLKGTISYVYDATGEKLQKITVENNVTVRFNNSDYSTAVTTTSSYLYNAVYESKVYSNQALATLAYTDKLQFLANETGRARYIDVAGAKPAHFEYDYFIKDHLGNVRMVLTEEQKQDIYPAATLEGNLSNSADAIYIENQFYSIDPAKVVNKPAAVTDYKNKNGGPAATDPPVNNNPNSNVAANSAKMYKLKADAGVGATGLGMALKVMSGDRIDIFGKTYYADDNTNTTNYDVPVLDILTGLLGAPGGATGGKGATPNNLNGIAEIYNAMNGFLDDPNRGGGTKPKAYINWVLLDENFRYVTGSFERVSQPNTAQDHQLAPVMVTRNGYLYVFASNESPVDVYFDNLQVIHTHGPLLEEAHYYPFGLVMQGISSRAGNRWSNKYGFNGNEIQKEEFYDGSGLELMDFNARTYDPQIGRFLQMDPMAELLNNFSTYSFGNNNPTIMNDPSGLFADSSKPKVKELAPVTVVGKRIYHKATRYGYDHSRTIAGSIDALKSALEKLQKAYLPREVNYALNALKNPGYPVDIRSLTKQLGVYREYKQLVKTLEQFKTIYDVLTRLTSKDSNVPIDIILSHLAGLLEEGAGGPVGLMTGVILSIGNEEFRDREERDLIDAQDINSNTFLNCWHVYNEHWGGNKGYGYSGFYMRVADLKKVLEAGYLSMALIKDNISYFPNSKYNDYYFVYFRTSLMKNYFIVDVKDVGYFKYHK